MPAQKQFWTNTSIICLVYTQFRVTMTCIEWTNYSDALFSIKIDNQCQLFLPLYMWEGPFQGDSSSMHNVWFRSNYPLGVSSRMHGTNGVGVCVVEFHRKWSIFYGMFTIGTWSTLVQVMVWCMMAPNHYRNQCWLITRGALYIIAHDHEGEI